MNLYMSNTFGSKFQKCLESQFQFCNKSMTVCLKQTNLKNYVRNQ